MARRHKSSAHGAASATEPAQACLLEQPDFAAQERTETPSQEDEAKELARIMKIEGLLESMNVASEELNAQQELAVTIENSRRNALQAWAAGSARLAKTIGSDRISRAAPHYRNQRLLATARRQVAAVTAAFLKASERCSSDLEREKLVARHARQVLEYQEAQDKLARLVRDASAPPPWLLEKTAPYFEAEAGHLSQLEDLRSAEIRCQRRVGKAKDRYQRAMRGLEALSEAEHRARAMSS